MLISNQKVLINICSSMAKWYAPLGYDTSKKQIYVDIEDLQKGSNVEIEIKCDYCGEIFKRKYKDYSTYKNKFSTVDKDSCKKCRSEKRKESTLITHGVEHTSQNKEVTNKRINTNMSKYGSGSPVGNTEILNKSEETSLNKYGKKYYMQTDEFKKRVVLTNLNKYGMMYSFQSEEAKIKARKTLYDNKSVSSSINQQYIHKIIGGKINFPIGMYNLDIAFPDEKIYVEYDGSGHNLAVSLNKITDKEFKRKEIIRYYFLKRMNWKQIQIIATTDKIPNDKILQKMTNEARNLLSNEDQNWVKYDIDNCTQELKHTKNIYDFGELISRYKIKQKLQDV